MRKNTLISFVLLLCLTCGCDRLLKMQMQASSSAAAAGTKITLAAAALAGACVPLAIVFKPAISVPSALTAVLSGSAKLFLDTACTAPLQTLTNGPMTFAISVYLRDEVVEPVKGEIRIAGQVLPFSIDIRPAGSVRLAMSGPTKIMAGECQPFSLKAEDSAGHPFSSTVRSALNVSAGVFSADDQCNQPLSSITLSNGRASNLYYRNTVAQPVVWTASDIEQKLLPASGASEVVGADPVKLVVAPETGTAGVSGCKLLNLSLEDRFQNRTLARSALPLSFVPTSGGFLGPQCKSGSMPASVAAGTGGFAFYHWAFATGDYNWQVTTSAPGVSGDTFSISVITPPSQKIVVSEIRTQRKDVCSAALTLSLQTTAGAPVVLSQAKTFLLRTGQAAIFRDSGCQQSIPEVTVAAGASSATFYLLDSQAETVNFQAEDLENLFSSSAVQQFKVLAQASSIVFKLGSLLPRRDRCVPFMSQGNVGGEEGWVAAGASVALAVAGPGAVFADAECTQALATIPVGAVFYFRGTAVDTVTLSGTSTLPVVPLDFAVQPIRIEYIGANAERTCCSASTTLRFPAVTAGNTLLVTMVIESPSVNGAPPAGLNVVIQDDAGGTYQQLVSPSGAYEPANVTATQSSRLAIYLGHVSRSGPLEIQIWLQSGGQVGYGTVYASAYEYYGVDENLNAIASVTSKGVGAAPVTGQLPSVTNGVYFAAANATRWEYTTIRSNNYYPINSPFFDINVFRSTGGALLASDTTATGSQMNGTVQNTYVADMYAVYLTHLISLRPRP